MQFTFGDKGEVHRLDESVLTVTEKRRREGKSSIGPRMKYGHAFLRPFKESFIWSEHAQLYEKD